ncbi:uncharacterized protein [Eurosta solidaginis]|uniref:uncharacterized protein n=1 Tax=Eurosta solidaginis TaxID=178769 RepID=UPI00353141EB
MLVHNVSLLFVFLITLLTTIDITQLTSDFLAHAASYDPPAVFSESDIFTSKNVHKSRVKRGIFWDFFQKMVTTKNLIVDQYVDTRDTLNDVFNLLNDGFSDPAPEKSTLRPHTSTTKTSDEQQSDNSEISTTTEAYRISRYELGRIIGRNFRGLQRLTKIEFQDAFNQSHYNIQEYKDEAHKQFANSVGVEKVNKLKGLKAALSG